ncbi:hypothetical protein MCOR02_004650 [Pyricularia oryzae]|uniref:Cytochrome b5 heme-binding domain-containing protein n=4 Tax=Pyricularia oryzae TaxID=318829 RepID=G4MKQ8_PYRO7|nr:uncharacterized protein MGG_06654 [Pyricularia oryzae 70-15]ELQ38630.1 hypothetical protein OOU_Y34scaffold00533g14 [Pyricularia oryzae Y34]KAH9435731.1 hypothetical protein MCOR02_004650 [Pyricularia oryzae]EHA56748.1 hypothetical protein MGG_06654 [Pyricularia oryzae 70-15]KAI6318348.1 hypothetical protein MCOR34_003611 [Pyricularia oryzae]KAI6466962.1 hypothetical protein MCOR17_004626 [Pyricularia oryzae]
MADEGELRQRKPAPDAKWTKIDPSTTKIRTKKEIEDEEDVYYPWWDLLRLAVGLTIAYCGLSYLATGGETYSIGYQVPMKYLHLDSISNPFRKPLWITPEELAAFDGSDENKPVYIAINGTIYDVSANRRTYGPGGSYQFFAGVDASRAYVTGCFAEDRTADMRGVEEMFLPLEDPEVNKQFSAAELEEMRKREREEAERKLHDALKHWVQFFRNHKKYRNVGRVKRRLDWLEKEPKKKLCKQAQEGRPKRKIPGDKNKTNAGTGGQ